MNQEQKAAYWRENLKIIMFLMFIWALVSFGFSILFVDALDQFTFMGFKLGFWFAQQGSIYIFVLLIISYIFLMKRLDKKYNLDV